MIIRRCLAVLGGSLLILTGCTPSKFREAPPVNVAATVVSTGSNRPVSGATVKIGLEDSELVEPPGPLGADAVTISTDANGYFEWHSRMNDREFRSGRLILEITANGFKPLTLRYGKENSARVLAPDGTVRILLEPEPADGK